MDIDILKSYKLTQNEWYTLTAVAAGHYAATGHKARSLDLDVLVLAGLVTRGDDNPVLTSDGHDAAAAIDMIFDWDGFAFAESPESPSDASDEPKQADALAEALAAPERLTVGSLVRHIRTGGVGLITKHTMYDANWGGFYVDFVKPVDNVINGRVTNQLSHMFDRADKFERV
jgi:hypothetical protein